MATISSLAKNQQQAQANAPKPGNDRLQQLAAKLQRLLDSGKRYGEEVAGLQMREPEAGSKAREPLTQLVNGLEQGLAELGACQKFLDKLHALKWQPPKPGPRLHKVGDKVTPRAGRLGYFTRHGAYTEADVASLVVVSTHGAAEKPAAKVRTVKGECLGVFPMDWFVPVAAEEGKASK